MFPRDARALFGLAQNFVFLQDDVPCDAPRVQELKNGKDLVFLIVFWEP